MSRLDDEEQREARLDAKMKLDLAVAEVMLHALRNDQDPDGPEAKSAINNLKSDFRKRFPS